MNLIGKYKPFCVSLLLLSSVALLNAKPIGKSIVLEGKFQNKNIYIQNASGTSGVGFCTYEVLVNGEVTTDEVNSSAFEIDLRAMRLKVGDAVTIEIRHKDDCSPKILNPEALKSKATFEVVSMNLSSDGILNWTTKNESGALSFVVEQFRWNKWVAVGEVEGIGSEGNHNYKFQTVPHSGENKFRVKQTGYGPLTKYSQSITFVSKISNISYITTKKQDQVLFSEDTMFEMYDVYGNVVKKGYNSKLDVANLPKGMYFLLYDNTMTEFKKK